MASLFEKNFVTTDKHPN